MTGEGKAIHLFASDPIFISDKLGCVPHHPVLEGAPETIDKPGIFQVSVLIGRDLPVSIKQAGRLAHALDATGDVELTISCPNGLGSQHDGLEA